MRTQLPTRDLTMLALLAGASLLATGCHHNTRTAYQPPPPPSTSTTAHYQPHSTPDAPVERREPSNFFDDTSGKPIFTEVGLATWYGAQYSHRAAADGVKYDPNGMTAAHRTLPLGTTARITNLATGQQVLVRITDRGPFVQGRVLDLSEGAAKAIGVYRMGVAKVRIEAFPHASADPAGKWCVQTGAFKTERDALDLKNALLHRYQGAKVIEFAGPTGYWVRIDPVTREKAQAEKIADWIGAPDKDSQAFLVRTD